VIGDDVTRLTTLFPSSGDDVPLARLLEDVSEVPVGGPLKVGDERVLAFLSALSRRLLRPDLARQRPELGSLGFFLRRGELERAIEHLADGVNGARRAPRGLVLHFPPANVDTIFVYSWAMSALAGNRNIVRISARSTVAAGMVLDALNDALVDAHPAIAQTQRMITYGHDEAITAALSAACDLRVIWGGDQAVTTIRQYSIPPHARDLTFPDRSSFAAISVPAWSAAGVNQRRAVVEGFANDVYWFDQAACSSPRNLCWVGDPVAAQEAREEFALLLGDVVVRRGWGVDAAMAIEKRVASYGLAASGAATSVTFAGNAIANVELAGLGSWQRTWLGAGTICHVTISSLGDLIPVIRRKDQTMAQFGFTAAELDAFVTGVAGRGVDRIVPIGNALTFAQIWDGFDLVHEFTRIVTIQA
jgi:hypothetical protein